MIDEVGFEQLQLLPFEGVGILVSARSAAAGLINAQLRRRLRCGKLSVGLDRERFMSHRPRNPMRAHSSRHR